MNHYLSEKIVEHHQRDLTEFARASQLARLALEARSSNGPLQPARWRRSIGRQLVDLGIVLGVSRPAREVAMGQARRLIHPSPDQGFAPGHNTAGSAGVC